MSDLYVKIMKYGDDFWTPVLMASYWFQVVTHPPILLEDSAWLFPHGCFYSIDGGCCPFFLAIPLSDQLLLGSRGTPHSEFLG